MLHGQRENRKSFLGVYSSFCELGYNFEGFRSGYDEMSCIEGYSKKEGFRLVWSWFNLRFLEETIDDLAGGCCRLVGYSTGFRSIGEIAVVVRRKTVYRRTPRPVRPEAGGCNR